MDEDLFCVGVCDVRNVCIGNWRGGCQPETAEVSRFGSWQKRDNNNVMILINDTRYFLWRRTQNTLNQNTTCNVISNVIHWFTGDAERNKFGELVTSDGNLILQKILQNVIRSRIMNDQQKFRISLICSEKKISVP